MQHRQFLVCTKLIMTTTICEEKLTRPLRKFGSSCLMSRQPELTNSSNNWLKRISLITWMLKVKLLYMLISSLWLVSEWLLLLQIDIGNEAHKFVGSTLTRFPVYKPITSTHRNNCCKPEVRKFTVPSLFKMLFPTILSDC